MNLFKYAIEYKNSWNKSGFPTPLLDWLLVSRLKNLLGGRVVSLFCGGAPLLADTQAFTRAAFGVVLGQAWALTECTACATVTDAHDFSDGRCGAPTFTTQVRLRDWEEGGYKATDKPRPRGELILGGRTITAGYYKRPQETEEAFEVDGDGVRWLASGDIGEIYPDGTIKVIDRKKDLVKLQHGEYISLGKVSDSLNLSNI